MSELGKEFRVAFYIRNYNLGPTDVVVVVVITSSEMAIRITRWARKPKEQKY